MREHPCEQMWTRWLKQQQVFWGDLRPLRSFICQSCIRLQLPHSSVAPHLLSLSACSNPLQSPLYLHCTLSPSPILFPPSLYLQGSHVLTASIATPSTSIRTLSTSQKSLTLFSPECPSMFVLIHDSRRNLQCHTVSSVCFRLTFPSHLSSFYSVSAEVVWECHCAACNPDGCYWERILKFTDEENERGEPFILFLWMNSV